MKLRVGIIGLGVGEAHIKGYSNHSAVEVVALCDFDPKRLADAKQKYPGLRLVENADDILKASDIDVVSIASYDNYHHAQIMTAIEHNKHIFVEKPMCLHDFEARDIRKALNNKKHLKMSSNLILRKCPRFIEIKKRIAAGNMGELFHMDGSYDYGRRQKIIDGWRGKTEHFSVVCGGGVHILDLFLWFSGKRAIEVMAYGNQIVTQGSGFRYNDSVSALIKFEGGMTGKLSVHFGCVMPHFHQLSVWGSKASFTQDPGGALFFSSPSPDQSPEIVREAYPGAHKGDLLYNFVDAIVNDVPLEVGMDDIFRMMSVCFAINRSLDEGRPIQVEYV